MISNSEIAQILNEMAAYYSMLRIDYKERAYELAAEDVLIYPESLADVYKKEKIKGLMKVPNVGNRIAKHIEELLKTGQFREYEEMRKKIPVDLKEMLQLEGVGPRTIYDLYLHLNVKNLNELEKACHEGQIHSIRGFGVRSQARICQAIEDYKAKTSLP